jgi:hypothetical protein
VIGRAWHGAVTTLVVADEPADKQLRRMEKDARRHGSEVRQVSHAEAEGLLRDAIASFWKYGAGPGTDLGEGTACCARAWRWRAPGRRCWAPSAAAVTDAAERWPAEARRALVEEFLASPQAAELRDPFARKVPHLLAMCCVGHLGCEPVLIGPSVLERVLENALPRATIAPDRFGKAVPQAVRAWTDWLADRNKLTDRSRRRLGFSLRATLARFAGAWYGPGAHPLRRYLEDLNDKDASTGNVVNAVVQRRMFAVPLPAERVDGLARGKRRVAARDQRTGRGHPERPDPDHDDGGERARGTAAAVPVPRHRRAAAMGRRPARGVGGSAAAARRRAVAGPGAGPADTDLGRAWGRGREVYHGAEGTVTVHPWQLG